MKLLNFKNRQGVTLIEMVLVVGIFLLLLGLGSTSFFPVGQKSSLQAEVTSLLSELKSAQIKAMVGDTEGRGINDDYGIFFESGKYTIFHGTYSPGDPSNFTVNIDSSVAITSTLPSQKIIFLKGSGLFKDFSEGQNTITIISSLTNEQKTINLNKNGVITSIN